MSVGGLHHVDRTVHSYILTLYIPKEKRVSRFSNTSLLILDRTLFMTYIYIYMKMFISDQHDELCMFTQI